ncbi:hypothetical protein Q3G72_022520 [Acer saccharum]|nr:hypothetical protein Q3G72_022520 [Acer saccharum]
MVMATSTQRIHASYSPLVAEAVAVLRGVISAIETRLMPFVVETDALVGFSAIPLTLYVPPIRRLTLFVEKMEDFIRDSTQTTRVIYPRLRRISSTFFSIILCCNSGSL